MKVSMNWLKELVDVDVDVSKLSSLFNLHSAEVEEYYDLVEATNLVVGHVVSKEKHPDADKLSVCQVDIGGEISQIVCGAPNVDQGQNVIVSLPGAVLPGGFKIKKSVIRDVESNGMICSLGELGIDKKYHNEDGIHVISGECKPGESALEALALDDQVMALDLTPNRADLLSVLGVAYDTAALLGKKVVNRDIKVEEIDTVNECKIELDTEFCMSYYARVIEDIEIKESPKWMQSRLIAAGMRPISNVVDITNYVMLETGQPLHAFDYDALETGKIVVRMAKDKEELMTLDDQKRVLSSDDIVITNGEKAVALGGVMGGLETEITSGSKRILLESAVFDPYHIRKTSNRLDLRSEASTRFERKVDPKRTILALEMATELFSTYASGKVLKGISKVDNIDYTPLVIEVGLAKINKVLGSDFDLDTVSDALSRLDFQYEVQEDTYVITAPTRRQDIETYQDIVEEVGRIIGYDKLPTTLPSTISQGRLNPMQVFKRKVQTILTGLGLDETITYSLVDEKHVFDFTKEESELVRLLMPMSSEKNVLCKTPINGLLDVIKYNVARKNSDLALFEIGKRYDKDKETILLSGAFSGIMSSTLWQGKKEVVDFYTVKGVLDSLFNEIGLGHLEYLVNTDYPNLHPGQSAYIKDRTGVIGFVGKVHPEYAKNNDLKEVYVFELDLEQAYSLRRTFKKVKEINKFPSIYRDIAIVLEKEVLASTVVEVIKKAGKRMLSDVSIFDLYVGENVEAHQKSLALRLEFSDPVKTLDSKEVEERVGSILKALEQELNASLR
jgi:phenylalanyl-tRNA synthetase beta chain